MLALVWPADRLEILLRQGSFELAGLIRADSWQDLPLGGPGALVFVCHCIDLHLDLNHAIQNTGYVRGGSPWGANI